MGYHISGEEGLPEEVAFQQTLAWRRRMRHLNIWVQNSMQGEEKVHKSRGRRMRNSDEASIAKDEQERGRGCQRNTPGK